MSTIAAGLLMIPPVLVMVGTLPFIALLSLPGLALLCYRRPTTTKVKASPTKGNSASSKQQRYRAIITGGSSGIGLAIAEECVQRGFEEVILIARNVEKLNQAKEKLKGLMVLSSNSKGSDNTYNKSNTKRATRIEALSVDVSKEEDLKAAVDQIFGKTKETNEEENFTFTCLFCNAGASDPGYFSDMPTTDFAKTVCTNQLGCIYTVHAFLPRISTGTIVLTSSILGQLGAFGFTSYSATKFALRGFAEALHMELMTRPISVCLAYPSDTDTPGLEVENLTKPIESKLISEDAGLAKPQDVARTMVQEACKENPNFAIYFSFDGWMVASLTAGFSPVTSLFEAASQVCGMCLFRVISLFYLKRWGEMVRSYDKNKPGKK